MKTKTWLIIATAQIVLGLIVFTVAMSFLEWDFTKLNTHPYRTNSHEITEDFESILIETDTADITFVKTDGICKVVCVEQEKLSHNVRVQNGTLKIELNDERSWKDYIGIHFSTPKITVYLPNEQYESLLVDADTSDVDIPRDFTFRNADITLSTGDVKLACCVLGKLEIRVDTGDIKIGDADVGEVFAKTSTGDIKLACCVLGRLEIRADTGDIEFADADAGEIFVKTSTGDVTGSLRTAKIFIAKTDTGDVSVPNSSQGGRCEICTDTGDIEITVRGVSNG